jgi:ribosomal protein S18 acetylase RimI-like enzyme
VKITIRRLEPGDDRTNFRSGNIDLDRFFEKYAGQNQFRHHIGTTYVALDEQRAIVGFATAAASEVTTTRLGAPRRRHLPAYPVPVLRLARLAVDAKARGLGVGNALLRHVLLLAQKMAVEVGCLGVLVDAKPEAVGFYEKLGFIALETVAGQLGDRPEPLPMFLELGAIPK